MAQPNEAEFKKTFREKQHAIGVSGEFPEDKADRICKDGHVTKKGKHHAVEPFTSENLRQPDGD